MAAQHPRAVPNAARPTSFMQAPMTTTSAPPGTFAPGTKVHVGNHRVVIEKYLSEGGFAHVYVVRVPLADGKTQTAVLKRVAVPDKENLANMRTEVETMKKLKGHKHIVSYMDSHASQLKGGGYEVFLLMEYCQGGGLIDFMNTRLKDRLTEPEILRIFSDATEGVACMHYLKPPLLHRDLKVENILIANQGASKTYKLCDFGSSAPPRPAAKSAQEGRLIEEDVQKHTTLQYRSPEMIDVYRKQPIDEKSDIWALGVLLYKLCYYTTPFEAQGQMAILNASFKYPPHPVFSDRLKLLIARMLSENPAKRPNVYQVLKEVCSMRGVACPVADIYTNRSQSEARNNQRLPPREPNVASPPAVGASYAPPEQPKQQIPEVAPMRRGRPGTATLAPSEEKQSSSRSPRRPVSSVDPFAALDSKNYAERADAVDQLAAKYPSLDDFSLLQNEEAKKFNFGSPSPLQASAPDQSLNLRLTHHLADEVFASSRPQPRTSSLPTSGQVPAHKCNATTEAPNRTLGQTPVVPQPLAQRPVPGSETKTSPPKDSSTARADLTQRPIWRVPSQDKPTYSLPARDTSIDAIQTVSRSLSGHRQLLRDDDAPRSPSSSRPSLEMLRPTNLDVPGPLHRSKSTEDRRQTSRTPDPPFSHTQSVRERKSHAIHIPHPHLHHSHKPSSSEHFASEEVISSNVDFLRAKEEEADAFKGHHRRHSSTVKKLKHGSLPNTISSTRHRLSDKLGDTLRRFEDNKVPSRPESPDDVLTPIEGSQRTDSPAYEDNVLEDSDLLSPEARREIERQRLSQEERRVAAAGMVYRQNLLNGQKPPQTRASAIQDRVKNLLDESGRTSPVKRTAEGYGRYTSDQQQAVLPQRHASLLPAATAMPLRPAMTYMTPSQPSGNHAGQQSIGVLPRRSATEKPSVRPAAPPKPVNLRTGGQSKHVVQSEEDFESPTSFQKRYPSLSLDLVEAEIATTDPPRRPLRVRDV